MSRQNAPAVAEERVERPTLIWERQGAKAVAFDVWPERPLTIGREGMNTVVIESAFVSKTHAVIRYVGGQYQVEDLKSANGTRVNGQSITTSVLVPGDVLEVGDQRFVFTEKEHARARGGVPAAGGGLHKNTKLAMTAILSLGVFGVLFALLAPSTTPAAGTTAQAESPQARPPAASASSAPPVDVNAPAVKEVVDRATQVGIAPVDLLFDEGAIALDAGRLREAAQLFGAASARDPKHEAAARRLEEAKRLWAEAIADHAAEAERAYDELRLNDAVLEWGQVALLTDESDVRHKAALDGIERARKRLAR